ncbi:hypothetical protein [uncultured Aquimarina sp.]|uniref:hypothetical protein n=1 Tax=uncultured Aquimarina sp. TaxID=575652 RepID=UPI0026226FD9|nr:hypothetical protein [uncultured Aquimarina sp.]
MASKNSIKVLSPTTDVEVNDSEHLITLDPGVTVSLEFTDTEGHTDEEIKNIQWIANMFHGRPQNSSFHGSLKGPKANFRVPTVYSGGGLGWVEPVLLGEQPTFKPGNGYFINAIGERSIDKVEWRDTHGNEISGSKFFTEAVQLHIYTTGLYGHEIQVTLYDKDLVSSNDQLELDEDVKNNTNDLAKYFNREVKVLQDADDDTSKVQKVVIDVRLEKRWGEKEESELELIADVVCKIDGGVKKLFDKNVLIIKTPKKEEEDKVNNATKSGNKPVIIGDIVTDVAEFKPCFYTKITGEVMRGEEKIQDVVIYEQGKTDPSQTVITFPVVAGTQYSKAQIKLTLDTDTEDCVLTNIHTDRVIDLSKIPEAVVVESRTAAKKNRVADSGNTFTGGSVKTRDSADENDGDNKGEHFSLGGNIDGPVGIKGNYDVPDEMPTTAYKKEAGSDTEVEIDLAYDFTRGGKSSYINGMLHNIWPIRKSKAITYPVVFNSCRKQHLLNIQVFPDIKWMLQFGFNYDKDKLSAMLKEEHRKYNTEVQKLEKAYEKETVTERQRERDLEEFKKRAENRKRKVEKKLSKTESREQVTKLSGELQKAERDIQKWDKKIENNRNKYQEEREQLKQDRKQAKKDKKYKIKDNLEPDDAVEDGLANITVGLATEWDRPYKGVELTANYQKARQFVEFIVKMEAHARKLVKGKDSKSQSEKQDSNKLEELKKALKGRELFSFEIIPPSIGLALIWYAEHPKTINEPSMGVVWEGEIKADPLIGIEFNFDIIALISKAHPIIKGLVVVMDLLTSLADEGEIRVDFNVEGKLNLEGKGRVNTYSGKTNFNREVLAKDEDDSPFSMSGEIQMGLIAQIKLINKYESWLFGDVETTLEAGAKVLTGITAEGKVKADDKGMYLEPTILFHGVKMVFHISASAKAKSKNKDPYFEASTEAQETLVLMNAYEWGAEAIGLEKWYLT